MSPSCRIVPFLVIMKRVAIPSKLRLMIHHSRDTIDKQWMEWTKGKLALTKSVRHFLQSEDLQDSCLYSSHEVVIAFWIPLSNVSKWKQSSCHFERKNCFEYEINVRKHASTAGAKIDNEASSSSKQCSNTFYMQFHVYSTDTLIKAANSKHAQFLLVSF